MKIVLLIVYLCSDADHFGETSSQERNFNTVHTVHTIYTTVTLTGTQTLPFYFLEFSVSRIFVKSLKTHKSKEYSTLAAMFSTLFILALSFIGSTLATTGVDVSQRTYSNSWGKIRIVLIPFFFL
jgi:hypothetical protein